MGLKVAFKCPYTGLSQSFLSKIRISCWVNYQIRRNRFTGENFLGELETPPGVNSRVRQHQTMIVKGSKLEPKTLLGFYVASWTSSPTRTVSNQSSLLSIIRGVAPVLKHCKDKQKISFLNSCQAWSN